MELSRLYEVMNLTFSFDAQVIHNNSPVVVESVKESDQGNMAQIKYLADNRYAEVPVAELSEAVLPIEEDEYITGWMTRMSPIIRS